MPNRVEPAALTQEQFELRLAQIKAQYERAYRSAKTLTATFPTAREIAMQRTMNMMVEELIVSLMQETNITVDCEYDQRVGHVPFPPKFNDKMVELTMLNFKSGR